MHPPATYHRAVCFFLATVFIIEAHAAPLTAPWQNITSLAQVQISSVKLYTYFASAAYCSPNTTLAWSCGGDCEANPKFIPVASGGDGVFTQYWFVGYNPTSKEVIVSHQGTDVNGILPLITDAEIFMKTLDPTDFPGLSNSIEVHSGFADAQASVAADVLDAVKSAMTDYQATKVTMVGHSLGAAIALLDSVYLPLHLDPSTTFRTFAYGMPRVGNQEFADYIDAHTQLTHINNKEDPIPILPGIFLGFHHPAGEIHIQDSDAWDACPGQDNPSTLCVVGDVQNLFYGDIMDHGGPYDGVEMGMGC